MKRCSRVLVITETQVKTTIRYCVTPTRIVQSLSPVQLCLLVCSNSCPLSWWCHPTISSSALPFSSCPQSFPASGAFPMTGLYPSGGQSIGASASILPINIQSWFPLGLTGLILQSWGLSRVFSSKIQKHQFFGDHPSWWTNSHLYMTTGKTTALTIWTFVSKGMSLLFNMLSKFVIASLLRSKHLLTSWLQSVSSVIHYLSACLHFKRGEAWNHEEISRLLKP